jgi:replicative DNA helicase
MQKNGRGWRQERENSSSNDSLVFGKVPPQAVDLEEAVLGAILLEKGALDMISDILTPSSFYNDGHSKIFAAMTDMSGKMPIDILTLTQEMKKRGELEFVGGAYRIMTLTNAIVSSANIEAHARIIQQKYMQRELIRISGEILKEAFEDTADIFDLLDGAETKLFEVTSSHRKGTVVSAKVVYDKELKELQERMDRAEDLTGVPSGLLAVDKVTYGWQPTDLIIVAARPSVGKTAFALNLARNAALNPVSPTGAAIFSLEMSRGQIMQRLISMESGVPLEKIKRGRMESDELFELADRCERTLRQAPIFIDDTPAINIFELRAKCRRLVHNHGVGVIIIDYLQLMSGSSERGSIREQEISKISRDLKAMAKELHVPVIALSQLSRDVEKRGSHVPMLSDLRESGAIEQDADMVMFLYRPDYQKEAHEVDPSVQGDVNLKIAKHRNGRLETIALKADLRIQKFKDIEPIFNSNPAPPGRLIPLQAAQAKFDLDGPSTPGYPDDELPF